MTPAERAIFAINDEIHRLESQIANNIRDTTSVDEWRANIVGLRLAKTKVFRAFIWGDDDIDHDDPYLRVVQ